MRHDLQHRQTDQCVHFIRPGGVFLRVCRLKSYCLFFGQLSLVAAHHHGPLIQIAADQQVDSFSIIRKGIFCHRVGRHIITVNDRSPLHGISVGEGRRDLIFLRRLLERLTGCFFQLFYRNILYLFDILFRNFQPLEDSLCQSRACLPAGESDSHGLCSAALDDSSLKQTFRIGSRHHGKHLRSAAGLSEQGDILRITAKGFDIVMNPLQGADNVRQPHIAGIFILFSVSGQIQEAGDAQPVIHGDHHDITAFA